MRAVLTAVIAAIEAAAAALAGFALIAVPTVLVWWLTFDLGADPGQVFDIAAAGWLLAHFVPIGFHLSAESALSYGLSPEALNFTISLAPLGATALTALLAVRAGWRFARRGGIGAAGVLGGLLGFGASAAVISTLGESLRAWPLWLSVLVPALCFGVCSGAAYLLRAATGEHDWWRASVRWVQRGFEPMSSLWAAALPARATETLRFAVASLLGLVGLGALGVTVAIVCGYVGIITLSQGLQLDLLGLLVVFLLNVILLPVMVIWGIAWFTGSGFAIGAGTSVTPFETLLGPLPVFPLLGAVPQSWGWAGGLAPALVVLLGVAIGVYGGARSELRRSSLGASIVVPILAAALAGLAVAGLSALAGGSIGPGRLSITGPDPWVTGGLAALELGIGMVPGVLAGRLDLDRLRASGKRKAALQPLSSEPGEFDPLGEPVPFVRLHAQDATGEAATEELDPLPHVPTRQDPAQGVSSDSEEGEEDPLIRAFSWEELRGLHGEAPQRASEHDGLAGDGDWPGKSR